jgi:hypothetical protein
MTKNIFFTVFICFSLFFLRPPKAKKLPKLTRLFKHEKKMYFSLIFPMISLHVSQIIFIFASEMAEAPMKN